MTLPWVNGWCLLAVCQPVIIGYAVSGAEYGFCSVYVADNVSYDFGVFVAYAGAAITVAATVLLAWCCPDGQWNTTNPRAKHVLLTACWVSAYAVWYPWVATVKLWAGFGLQPGSLGAALASILRVAFSLALGAFVSLLLSKSFTMATVALSKLLVPRRASKVPQARSQAPRGDGHGDLQAGLLDADATPGAATAPVTPGVGVGDTAGDDGDWYDSAAAAQHEADSAEALLHRLLVSAPTMLGVGNPADETGAAARAREATAAAVALVLPRESHTAGWSAGGYEVVDIG